MNKILKNGAMAFVALAATALTACVDDYSYTPSKDETGVQAYFSNSLGTKFDVDLNGNQLRVPVNRANRTNAATVQVQISSTSGDGKLFTFPSSELSYAAGDSVAYLNFSYDPSKMNYGQYDTITVKIADQTATTVYGNSEYTFAAGASAYRDMDGTGYYREAVVAEVYGVGGETYPVKIQENVVEKGKYRVVNPYSTNVKWTYANVGSYDASSDHYIEIDATDPDYVYVVGGYMGRTLNASEGELWLTSHIDYYMSDGGYDISFLKQNAPQKFGKLVDGVITMPSESMIWGLSVLGVPYGLVSNDQFAVALPGHSISDHSMSYTQTGVFTDTQKNSYIVGDFTLGADLTSLKYAVTTNQSEVESLTKGLILNQVEPLGEVTESGEVRIPVNESGTHYIVMVGYDGTELAGSSVASVEVNLNGGEKEVYKEIASGTYTIGAEDISGNFFKNPNGMIVENAVEQEAVLSQGTKDPTKFRITPYLVDGYPLDFSIDANGIITVEPQASGIPNDKYTILFADFYTWFTYADPDFAKQLDDNGWRSQYNEDEETYYFFMNFCAIDNGQYGNFGIAELDTYEVLDRNEAAVQKAFAKAKKAAAARKYIFRPTENTGVQLKSMFSNGASVLPSAKSVLRK